VQATPAKRLRASGASASAGRFDEAAAAWLDPPPEPPRRRPDEPDEADAEMTENPDLDEEPDNDPWRSRQGWIGSELVCLSSA